MIWSYRPSRCRKISFLRAADPVGLVRECEDVDPLLFFFDRSCCFLFSVLTPGSGLRENSPPLFLLLLFVRWLLEHSQHSDLSSLVAPFINRVQTSRDPAGRSITYPCYRQVDPACWEKAKRKGIHGLRAPRRKVPKKSPCSILSGKNPIIFFDAQVADGHDTGFNFNFPFLLLIFFSRWTFGRYDAFQFL